MPVSRPRSAADVHRELESTEQRFAALVAQWQASATTRALGADGPDRDLLDRIEELLRHQRGTLDRLHQLWIEYAQLTGHHAPQ